MSKFKHDNTGLTGKQYVFHPFEIAFCGYSGSGKTTLICKVIDILKSEFDIGYVKHDIHGFQIDKEGKDTFKAWSAGAAQIFISDSEHTATIFRGAPQDIELKSALWERDLVFIEGFKNSPAAKIVVLDEQDKILTAVKNGEMDGVVAFVGRSPKPENLPDGVPFLNRDDAGGIAEFVRHYFQTKIQAIPLYGLVLAGGPSSRMESDKALLDYYGKPQAEICYELLSSRCESTFISSRSNQWSDEALNRLPRIHDTFLGIGPMGGILSAMQKFPSAAWLVIACDLPFLDQGTLDYLLANRGPYKMATCFQSAKNEFPEPLCTIYEPKAFPRLLQFLGMGYLSPGKVLMHSPIKLVKQRNANSLENINTREEYLKARKEIEREGRT